MKEDIKYYKSLLNKTIDSAIGELKSGITRIEERQISKDLKISQLNELYDTQIFNTNTYINNSFPSDRSDTKVFDGLNYISVNGALRFVLYAHLDERINEFAKIKNDYLRSLEI